jgi:hypothetical protein
MAAMFSAISETVPLKDEGVDLRALSLKLAGLHHHDVLELRVGHAATPASLWSSAPSHDLIHWFLCMVQSTPTCTPMIHA